MSGIPTIQGNLEKMAKEQEDAFEKADKLSKKGGKANAQKVESANSRLQNANQQWDSQAPFIFETLQALDETRLNHLRDVLTQYETHEADQIERNRITVEQTLSSLLEVDTSQEIRNWSRANVSEKPQRRAIRQQSTAGSSITSPPASMAPPATSGSAGGDDGNVRNSEQSGRLEPHAGERPPSRFARSFTISHCALFARVMCCCCSVHAYLKTESKLKSRFGTMIGRRRQSIHGGFARAPSPSKGAALPSFPSFGRNASSRDGRPSPSPRQSSNNLRETSHDNRLSSLAESPTIPRSLDGHTNGVTRPALITESTSNITNGAVGGASPDLSGIKPPPGPPPSHLKENRKDSEGFTVPSVMDDPISQAQQEAAQDSDQPQFNVAIRNEPIPEQDADAAAALSSVANTLRYSQAVTPNRKVGTVRGRRDVRNTIYMPSGSNSLDVTTSGHVMPPSPGIQLGRSAALAVLSSNEHAPPSTSDTTSIRSGHSLMSNAVVRHADMHNSGLNASFIETVNATLEGGRVKTTEIKGEIALIFNGTESDTKPSGISSSPNDLLEFELIFKSN